MHGTFNTIIQTIEFPEGTVHWTAPLQHASCVQLRAAGFQCVGISDAPLGYVVERRGPAIHEVLFTLSGRGSLYAGKEIHALYPGSAMLLPAGSWYRYESHSPAWRIMWFHGCGTALWEDLIHGYCHVREAAAVEELRRVTEGLLSESLRDDAVSRELMATFSQQIVLYLQRELQTSKTPHDRKVAQLLRDLWSQVEKRPGYAWNVKRMAEQLFMSEAHFFRTCLRHMGCSPMRMLLRLRMHRAEELLSNHDFPLKTIANLVGYASPFAFSNAFKRHQGMSPSEFRSQSGHSPKAARMPRAQFVK